MLFDMVANVATVYSVLCSLMSFCCNLRRDLRTLVAPRSVFQHPINLMFRTIHTRRSRTGKQ